MNKPELIKRCEELGINPEPLTNNTLREEAIKAREAELAAEKEEKTTEVSTEATEDAPEATKEETTETPVESKEVTSEATEEAPEATSEEEKVSEKAAVYEDERGRKWAFKKTAPKTINIDGHPVSQQEILETEEFISELVYGNSSFLTQIH